MVDETDTLEIAGEPSADARAPGGAGLVLLYAPEAPAGTATGPVPAAVPLGDEPLVLGREPPEGGLALPFGSVSRVHARVSRRRGTLVVDDLDSRNGTFVNGSKVEHAELADGDELRVGEVLFLVRHSSVARHLEAPAPVGQASGALSDLRGGVALDGVRREILRVARVDLSVLVLGETGSGKELVARALHAESGRPGRLASVNCAAIPAALLESELFGHKRGAFTGADRDRPGLVKSADRGTLFLDEIGEMPLEAQAKVLRLLESRQVTPLGSHVAEPVDLRIVCATHRPLAQLVKEERFRGDLYARINAHTIWLPPLRERKEDIRALARFFLAREGAAPRRVTPAFMLGLVSYDWPFNVRELEAAVKRAVALSDDVLDERHLPPDAAAALRESRRLPPALAPTAETDGAAGTGGVPAEAELRALLTDHAGNLAAVARALGKDRVQVRRWLKRHGIALEDFRGG